MNATRERLFEAAKAGDLSAVRQIVAESPSLVTAVSPGETPVIAALYRGHHDVVKALVEAGAPLDIFAASALGRVDRLASLIASAPAAVNSHAYDGWTPLHLAAFFGHLDVAERLLAAGAEIAAVSANSLRNTPLHAAVAGGHVEAALRLIEAGAPVNVPDAGGHTPLHIAAEAGYVPVVRALLARGADPHAVDAEDRTPLARAAARNHNEVIDLINLEGR